MKHNDAHIPIEQKTELRVCAMEAAVELFVANSKKMQVLDLFDMIYEKLIAGFNTPHA